MATSIVYSATCIDTGMQYIGCTKQGIIRRKNLHAAEARRGKSGKFMDAIRSFGADGFAWAVEREFDDHAAALEYERILVDQRRSRSLGYNTYRGGQQNGGRTRTVQERSHLREKAHQWQSSMGGYGKEIAGKLRDFYATDEGKKQLATRKSTANRPEVRSAMSASHGGKPIDVFKDGAFVARYLTQGECAREMGISQGNLWACLHGRARSLRGFTFKFASAGDVVSPDAEGDTGAHLA